MVNKRKKIPVRKLRKKGEIKMKAIRINNDIIVLNNVKKVETLSTGENTILIFKYLGTEKEVWSTPIPKSDLDIWFDKILAVINN